MEVDPLDAIRVKEKTTKIVEDRSQENALGKDAFLKIFIAQLESQDPLNPQDSTQLSAQLAQFSQLEQSLQTTEALKGIGEQLDELIELSGGGAGARIDPVSLIGKQIDFPADELTPPATGSTAPLQLPVPSSTPRSTLLIEVEDVATKQRGLFSMQTQRGTGGARPALPPGDYALRFENGAPVLAGPASLPANLDTQPFRQLRVNEQGEGVLDADAGPFRFFAGQRYRFKARLVDAGGGEPSEIDLRRSAAVTSVRIRDGVPVAVADGVEVDPARILSIRN